jgi:hypothetical protein
MDAVVDEATIERDAEKCLAILFTAAVQRGPPSRNIKPGWY